MRVCKLILIIFFLSIATCGAHLGETDQKTQEKWLSYQPTIVELKGTLIIKTYYGPPNYGENPDTDAKEALPVLILNTPVNVWGNPNPKAEFDRKPAEDVREVQLVLAMPHKQFIGKALLVRGTLFHAFTGHHHTEVLMDVRSIKLDPKASNGANGR